MFLSRSLIVLVLSMFSLESAYAHDKLLGCWSNVTNVSVDPSISPTHERTESSCTIICFKKHGLVTTDMIGGFEALGSSGKFVYRSGHLTVLEDDIADGWVFSHRKDHCAASVSNDKLEISGCKEWSSSKVLLLHKQITPPELTGVAAGVFR